MPAYPITQPINGINQNLFTFKVNKEFFQEYVKITPLMSFSGQETNRVIYRKKLESGDGLQIRFSKLNQLDYKNPVIDFDQVRGAAQEQQMDEDRADTYSKSFSVQLKGYDIIKLGTPIYNALPDKVRPQLLEACQRNLNWDLFNAATTSNYAVATQKPSYDRIVASGYAPNRGAYNALAGITTVLNGQNAGTAYNQNGLSAAHLRQLKLYAERGGAAANMENAIRPAYMNKKSGWPMNGYIYLAHPATVTQLMNDPLFLNTTMARGTITDSMDQPQAIDGADYIGKFFGIHIYECQDLTQYEILSQDGAKTAAWNLFLGAGAWGLAWYENPNIVMDIDEVERIQLFATHEARAQKVLKFKSKQQLVPGETVEQGIIHSFVRIA
jgi:hypothetical protein